MTKENNQKYEQESKTKEQRKAVTNTVLVIHDIKQQTSQSWNTDDNKGAKK